MQQHGGYRPGAGRPKGTKLSHTLKTEKVRNYMIKQIEKEIRPILKAQVESAKGLYYEKKAADGTITVYKKEPDTKTGEYLINQVAGKPKETMEVYEDVTLKIDV